MLRKRLLRPAGNFTELAFALDPNPLVENDEYQAFYRQEYYDVSGAHAIERIALGLQRSFGQPDAFYKAFLIGPSGSGKSTQMSRLIRNLSGQYVTIRFSAFDLDRQRFDALDLAYLMMLHTFRYLKSEEGPGEEALRHHTPGGLLEEMKDSLSRETETSKEEVERITSASGSGALSVVSMLGAKLEAQIRSRTFRARETVAYKLRPMSDLESLANRFFDAARVMVGEASGKELLFVGEDFDKRQVSTDRVRETFVAYGEHWDTLRAHMVFSLPAELAYSEDRDRLAFGTNRHVMPAAPVFDHKHQPHEAGRKALRSVLLARANPKLFAPGTIEWLIAASGGNLRDLFGLTVHAGDMAEIRGRTAIEDNDVVTAVNEMRREFSRSLGESGKDDASWPVKAQTLLDVYQGKGDTERPTRVARGLLALRALQEYNDRGRYGVHPLVVDILKEKGRGDEKGRLPADAPGGTEPLVRVLD